MATAFQYIYIALRHYILSLSLAKKSIPRKIDIRILKVIIVMTI